VYHGNLLKEIMLPYQVGRIPDIGKSEQKDSYISLQSASLRLVKESQGSRKGSPGNEGGNVQKLLPVSGSFFLALRFSGADNLLGVLPLLPATGLLRRI
jgi:hypothetical protein